MTNNYTEWDMKIAQWRGETLKALEDLNKDIDEIKTDVKDIKKRMVGVQIKAAGLGGSIGLICGLIVSIIISSVL